MKEEWKRHPTWKRYEISNHGSVRRIKASRGTWIGKVLKPVLNTQTGYLFVGMRPGPLPRPIHRLVLETFICFRPKGKQARHLDGNKTNNRLDNLCWGTQKENEEDKARHGRRNHGSRHGLSKLTEIDVHSIIARYNPYVVTQQELADEYGISRTVISNILSGKAWTHVTLH